MIDEFNLIHSNKENPNSKESTIEAFAKDLIFETRIISIYILFNEPRQLNGAIKYTSMESHAIHNSCHAVFSHSIMNIISTKVCRLEYC